MLVTNRSYDICHYKQNNTVVPDIQASDNDQAEQQFHSVNYKSKDCVLFFPAAHLYDQEQKKKRYKCDNRHPDRFHGQISYILQKIPGREILIDIMDRKSCDNGKERQNQEIDHAHANFQII